MKRARDGKGNRRNQPEKKEEKQGEKKEGRMIEIVNSQEKKKGDIICPQRQTIRTKGACNGERMGMKQGGDGENEGRVRRKMEEPGENEADVER